METSTKAYVPAAFTRVSPIVRSGLSAVARAPARLRPRINSRTGLMECPIHQLGGSTLVISGGAADNPAARTGNKIHCALSTERLYPKTHRPARRLLFPRGRRHDSVRPVISHQQPVVFAGVFDHRKPRLHGLMEVFRRLCF